MLSRRDLISAGVVGGLAASTDTSAGPPAGERQPQAELQVLRDIHKTLEDTESVLRGAFQSNTLAFGAVGKIRSVMEVYFRANTKFPDFIDIGVSVFMELYDWHVKNRQQLMITRAPDGRYWLQFMFTSMVLRQEVAPEYIGIPYDKA